MSERIVFRGCLRKWIAALWCEYVLSTDPATSTKDDDDFVARYLSTYFRFPTMDRRRDAA